jgi:hypothetical protein
MPRDGQYRLLHASLPKSKRIRAVGKKTVKGDKWWRIACHLLYTWMISFEDDDRRLPGDPLWIMTNVVRYEDLSIKEIEEMLIELDRVKLVLLYESHGDKYIQIIEKKGDDKQRIRKDRYKKSIYPAPPLDILSKYQEEDQDNLINSNGSEPAADCQPDDNHLVTGPPPSGDKSTTQSSSLSSSLSSSPTCVTIPPEQPNDNPKFLLFEKEFWQIYPDRDGKKTGKEETFRKFCQIPENEVHLCLLAVRNFASSRGVKNGIGIKDPIRFLWDGKNKKWFWRDWIEPERKGTTKQDGISSATQKLKDAIGEQKQITDNAR